MIGTAGRCPSVQVGGICEVVKESKNQRIVYITVWVKERRSIDVKLWVVGSTGISHLLPGYSWVILVCTGM